MAEQVPFEKIVVPLDGSKWAEKAIPHAEQIARGGGELMLVHVFRPSGSEFLSDSAIAGQTSHIEEARKRAEQYVKSLRGRIRGKSIQVSAHLIEGGDTAQLICNFVNAEEADVVVMPAASHHRLVRVLMGDLTSSIGGCVNACLLLVRGKVEAEWDAELQPESDIALTSPVTETASPESQVLLNQLSSLHAAGILSAEEFAIKKAAIENR